jgi:hypothetical protein
VYKGEVRSLSILGRENPKTKRRGVYDETRDEMIVICRLVDLLDDTFTIVPIGSYAPFSACGNNKKPDVIIKHDFSATGIILEIDENCHRSYDSSCEYAKALNSAQLLLSTLSRSYQSEHTRHSLPEGITRNPTSSLNTVLPLQA